MSDVFTMYVESTSGRGPDGMAEAATVTVVEVLASTTNEATLTALEMVAARGRCPTSVTIDWDEF